MKKNESFLNETKKELFVFGFKTLFFFFILSLFLGLAYWLFSDKLFKSAPVQNIPEVTISDTLEKKIKDSHIQQYEQNKLSTPDDKKTLKTKKKPRKPISLKDLGVYGQKVINRNKEYMKEQKTGKETQKKKWTPIKFSKEEFKNRNIREDIKLDYNRSRIISIIIDNDLQLFNLNIDKFTDSDEVTEVLINYIKSQAKDDEMKAREQSLKEIASILKISEDDINSVSQYLIKLATCDDKNYYKAIDILKKHSAVSNPEIPYGYLENKVFNILKDKFKNYLSLKN